MNITILRTNGREEIHTILRARAMEAIEHLIGAQWLSTINLRDGRVMLIDDNGYETRTEERTTTVDGNPATVISLVPLRPLKPFNDEATKLYHSVCKPGTTHRIVGDVALVNDADFSTPGEH